MVPVTRKVSLLCALLVSSICLLLYLPVLKCGFVNFDDPEYVLNNPLIRELSPANLATMFTQPHVGWWMPLTWLSLAIDYQFWALNPAGYHLTNIVLHAVNSGLVVLIADSLCRTAARPQLPAASGYRYAWMLLFGGLFFGVHPLRVESVAWITERKDVLNGFFAFSSILFYLHYAKGKDRRQDGWKTSIYYALSLLCFVCSLMTKSVSVVLPAMLVVLDWVPLGRMQNRSLQRLIMEKWPFWLATVLMTFFTLAFAAQSQYLVTYEAFPLSQRAVVSGNAIWEYCRLLLFPMGLSPFNVIPDPIPTSYAVKAALVAATLAWMGIAGWRRFPRLASSTLCAILPLLPVLAFFQNGDQSYADRFTYLPSLSPAIFLALYFSTTFRGVGIRRGVAAGAALAIAVFLVATFRQQSVWRSPETFWSRTIQIEPLAITYKERGRYYHAAGRYKEAVADFTAALGMITPTLKPFEYNFYALRAESLREAGMLADAVADFNTAIGLHPHPSYYFHRGLALQAMGKNAEAEEDFRRAGPDPGPINWVD